MIGNDIVDLNYARKTSNWQRPRFLDKVFTKKEQAYISNSEDKHQMVWLLWSMKEAAYKVNVQQFGKRFLNPKKLECFLNSKISSQVITEGETYYVKSTLSENFTYSVASLKETIPNKSEWFEIENGSYLSQRNTLRTRFFKYISKEKNINISDLKIKINSNGIPMLFSNNLVLNSCFSFTHHGRFCGFSLSL